RPAGSGPRPAGSAPKSPTGVPYSGVTANRGPLLSSPIAKRGARFGNRPQAGCPAQDLSLGGAPYSATFLIRGARLEREPNRAPRYPLQADPGRPTQNRAQAGRPVQRSS